LQPIVYKMMLNETQALSTRRAGQTLPPVTTERSGTMLPVTYDWGNRSQQQ
jgi:hypothetical protein